MAEPEHDDIGDNLSSINYPRGPLSIPIARRRPPPSMGWGGHERWLVDAEFDLAQT
jgi:hypothetical protein